MKTLITTAALIAAGTAFANAAETISLITGTNVGTRIWNTASTLGGGTSSSHSAVNAVSVYSVLNSQTTQTWISGYGQKSTNEPSETSYPVWSAKPSESDGAYSFTYLGRSTMQGSYVTWIVSVSDLLSENGYDSTDSLTNFSISFDASGATAYSYFSAWYIADGGTTATSLISETPMSSSNSFSSSETLSGNDKIVLLFNSQSKGSTTTISNLSATATVVSTIPEPSAFGLLAGIGALVLVASRRRRKAA